MFPDLRRNDRRLRRATRPALAALLVLAQGVAAFGGPVVIRHDGSVRPCGCKVKGPLAACCCGPGGCCDPVAELVPQPAPEPEPPACPHCPAKARAKTEKPAVLWVAVLKARQCGGEGPLGLVADIPAVPPVVPAAVAFAPRLTHSVSLTDLFATSPGSIPPDPPPRRG